MATIGQKLTELEPSKCKFVKTAIFCKPHFLGFVLERISRAITNGSEYPKKDDIYSWLQDNFILMAKNVWKRQKIENQMPKFRVFLCFIRPFGTIIDLKTLGLFDSLIRSCCVKFQTNILNSKAITVKNIIWKNALRLTFFRVIFTIIIFLPKISQLSKNSKNKSCQQRLSPHLQYY